MRGAVADVANRSPDAAPGPGPPLREMDHPGGTMRAGGRVGCRRPGADKRTVSTIRLGAHATIKPSKNAFTGLMAHLRPSPRKV